MLKYKCANDNCRFAIEVGESKDPGKCCSKEMKEITGEEARLLDAHRPGCC